MWCSSEQADSDFKGSWTDKTLGVLGETRICHNGIKNFWVAEKPLYIKSDNAAESAAAHSEVVGKGGLWQRLGSPLGVLGLFSSHFHWKSWNV